jgi:hypothetical protein
VVSEEGDDWRLSTKNIMTAAKRRIVIMSRISMDGYYCIISLPFYLIS